MLDLILKLIDRLIDLSKRREEVNRRTFSDFVQPTFEIFEKVHVDYIESLTRYITTLSDETLPMDLDHPVLKDMELDSLKTAHLRAKLEDITAETAPDQLRELLTAIRIYLRGISTSSLKIELLERVSRESHMDFDELDQLLNPHYEPSEAFLIFGDASDPTRFTGLFSDDPMRQVLRPMLLGFDAAPEAPNQEDLAAVNYRFYSQNKKRELCLNAVKEAMMHFQYAYGSISSSYAKLRSKLLSPL